ncbi:MAG: peptidoglycan editing factor PgeF [Peptococcaceae bacterium]|nr:peptidoglycan editing factor PgeF [Peptococcaceae bacterium]
MKKKLVNNSVYQQIREFQGLRYLSFDLLEKTGIVNHAFTTRQGGFSQGSCNSLNMTFTDNDRADRVVANREKAAQALGYNLKQMVCGQQVHGTSIRTVSEIDKGRGNISYLDSISDTDGLITNVPGLLLASFYADCVPIFLVDPVKKVIGLVHAGWRGSVAKIAESAIFAMNKSYKVKPEDCLAVIGPSIGACCYEVDELVRENVAEKWLEPEKYFSFVKQGHWRLDLPLLNKDIMINAGLAEESIFLSGICTACNQDLFFSYRGQKGDCGRMASLMGLKI